MSRQLSQTEIDAVFENMQERKHEAPAVKFDFRRPDRIPKSQVRAIHLLHDTFVRNLVSSSVRVPAFLSHGESGERGAALLCRIPRRPAFAHVHDLAGTFAVRWQRRHGVEPVAGLSDSRDAVGGQRKIFDRDSAGRHRDRAKTAGWTVSHHSQRSAGGVEGRDHGRFHDRSHGNRAATSAHSGAQRGRGFDRHRNPASATPSA